MSLLSTIRNDALAARKARDTIAASLLVTLLSEAEIVGLNDGKRESTDTEVIATIRKFLKNNGEARNVRPNDETLLREAQILESYLPRQLGEDELRQAILDVAKEAGLAQISVKDTGVLMKGLNAKHAGQFNGGQASAIIKSLNNTTV